MSSRLIISLRPFPREKSLRLTISTSSSYCLSSEKVSSKPLLTSQLKVTNWSSSIHKQASLNWTCKSKIINARSWRVGLSCRPLKQKWPWRRWSKALCPAHECPRTIRPRVRRARNSYRGRVLWVVFREVDREVAPAPIKTLRIILLRRTLFMSKRRSLIWRPERIFC